MRTGQDSAKKHHRTVRNVKGGDQACGRARRAAGLCGRAPGGTGGTGVGRACLMTLIVDGWRLTRVRARSLTNPKGRGGGEWHPHSVVFRPRPRFPCSSFRRHHRRSASALSCSSAPQPLYLLKFCSLETLWQALFCIECDITLGLRRHRFVLLC